MSLEKDVAMHPSVGLIVQQDAGAGPEDATLQS